MKLENEKFMEISDDYKIIKTLDAIYDIMKKINKTCLKHYILLHADIITKNKKSYIKIKFKSGNECALFALYSSLSNISEIYTDKKRKEIITYIDFKSEREIVSMSDDTYIFWFEDLKSYLKFMYKSLKNDLKYV